MTSFPYTVSSAVLFVTCLATVTSGSNQNNNVGGGLPAAEDYPFGDPRRCTETARQSGREILRFEVLPGFGWDNLRNLDQGQVIQFNYSHCRATDDGRFLLPDSVSAVPVKSSSVEEFAELIEHWKDWTSISSKSINVDAGLQLKNVGVSGKFSADFQDIKTKQIGDKSLSTRAQVRYVRYNVRLQPDTPLHPTFRNRLLDIAAALEMNQTEQARYLSQLVVRDFGTHVITGADAGAALVQVSHLHQDWMESQSDHKSDILLAASISLYSVFHMTTSFKTSKEEKFQQGFNDNRTSSKVVTAGGPIFRPSNFTPDSWASDVDRDLVAIDHTGDPLHYVVTAGTLPELPASILAEVSQLLKDAVEAYYDYNIVRGCLDRKSPNFVPAANVDDGTCHPPSTNLTFGGMYQTCTMTQTNNGDLCGGMTQVNPATGGYSCPSGYQNVLVYQGSMTSGRTQRDCHRYHLIFHRCNEDYYASAATYQMYWCAALGPVAQKSGYLFGGLFTSQVVNAVTQSLSCPPTFFALKVGLQTDLHVCISDDYELGLDFAVPFAGFHSCQAGNPLAVGSHPSSSNHFQSGRPSLRAFFQGQPGDWPKGCPDGYSQHLATIDQGCQINYCVHTGALAGAVVLPPIKRPPFMPTPSVPAPSFENAVSFNPSSRTWTKDQDSKSSTTDAPTNPAHIKMGDNFDVLTPGAAAGIAVAVTTLACIIVGFLGFIAVRSNRRRLGSEYKVLHSSREERLAGYGSGNTRDSSLQASQVCVDVIQQE